MAVPESIKDRLDEMPPDHLDEVADYAKQLAEEKQIEQDLDEADDQSQDPVLDEQGDELPDDVSAKATLTVKEINDNRYYYWQWREGDKVKSCYKGPVDGDG